jgi:putative CocE/NonD family hydrolase
MYLHSGTGPAHQLAGSLQPGSLSPKLQSSRTTESYFTNPLAGWSMGFDSYGTIAASPYVPTDQRAEEGQGLTWRSAPASVPQRLIGPVQLHLRASSTATDTDWVAKLSDVGPDGSETIITEGGLRASHRAIDPARSTPGSPYHLEESPTPLVPRQPYSFDVAIIPTAHELAPGHQLQLRLTTDDMPTRLPGSVKLDAANPAQSQVVALPPATNTVLEGGKNGSWLLVPLQDG